MLISAPFAFGQTALVAVQVPLANAATPPLSSDAELQAKVDLAAQALAKLPANTPGLATATARVAAARASVVVPVGFSLGQSGRAAHLVLDNLRSARVWCQANAQIAKADDKVLLNSAIELLQSAEKLAQQKVDVLDKPETRTWEELRADSVRLLEESREFLKGVEEREVATDEELERLRAEGAETVRQFQQAKAELDALPKPLTPEEQQKELQSSESRKKELETLLQQLPSPELAQALKANREASKEYEANSTAFSLKLEASFELRKQLNQPGLTDKQKQKIKAQIAIVDEAKEQARQKYKDSLDKLQALQARVGELRQPTANKKLNFVWPAKASAARICQFRLIQNGQLTVEELAAVVESLRLRRAQAAGALSLAERLYDVAYYAQESLPGLIQDAMDANAAVTSLQNQNNNLPMIKEAYETQIVLKQKAIKDAESRVAKAKIAVKDAKAAVTAAQKALNAYLALNPPSREKVCQLPDDELTRLRNALTQARDSLTRVEADKTTAIKDLTFAQEDLKKEVADFKSFKVRAKQLPQDLEVARMRAELLNSEVGKARGLANQETALFIQKSNAQLALERANTAFDLAVAEYDQAVGN